MTWTRPADLRAQIDRIMPHCRLEMREFNQCRLAVAVCRLRAP